MKEICGCHLKTEKGDLILVIDRGYYDYVIESRRCVKIYLKRGLS